jgi:Flp pilus assembly protein TadD
MKSFTAAIGLYAGLLLSYGPGVNAQTEKGPNRSALHIMVWVRNQDNSPARPGIMVRLDASMGGSIDQQPTDSGGKVTFLPKALTMYVVSIREAGFKEVSRTVDLSMIPTGSVTIQLVPSPDSHEPQGINIGQLQRAVSAKELQVPDPARKEFEAGRKLLQDKHDAPGSVGHFRKATELYRDFPQAYTMLGLALLQDQKLKDSHAALQKAVELDPRSAPAYLTLGACLNQEKDYAGAEKALTQGLEFEPESPEGHYELAKTYWAMHRWQDAEPHAVKAEKLQPGVPGVHVLMGNISLQKRDNATAVSEFKEYLRLQPQGPMSDGVRNMIAKLEKLAKN